MIQTNLSGTNKDFFSIGIGKNKIELRSIDGVLYFRNYGSGWRKFASVEQLSGTIIKEWPQDEYLEEGEIIRYGNTLWYVNASHTSGSTFEENVENCSKLEAFNKLTKIDTVLTSSPTDLDVTASEIIYFHNQSGSGDFEIKLPTCDRIKIGTTYLLINDSTKAIKVLKSDGVSLVALIQPAEAKRIVYFEDLIENSINIGEWTILNFGGSSAGGGGSVISIPKGSVNFDEGEAAFFNATSGEWEKAIADGTDKEGIGIISKVNANNYDISLSGEINLPSANLTPGEIYFVSDTTPGLLTVDEGIVSNPLMLAISSTQGVILQYRPSEASVGISAFTDTFVGVASQQSYTLSHDDVIDVHHLWVWIDDVIQQPTDYTLSGETITLTQVIVGAEDIRVRGFREILVGKDWEETVKQYVPTGIINDFTGLSLPPGFIWGAGKTIGNAVSNATERANEDTKSLFLLYWEYSDSVLPIKTSAGDATTRASYDSAIIAFNAGVRMTTPDLRGRVTIGRDNMSAVAANRITTAASGIDGIEMLSAGGSQVHILTTSEMPLHSHGLGTAGAHNHVVNITGGSHAHGFSLYRTQSWGSTGTSFAHDVSYLGAYGENRTTSSSNHTHNASVSSNGDHTHSVAAAGDDAGHNNVQPSIIVNKIIKL